MIKKERKVPLKVEKLKALLRRLPKSHVRHKEVEAELAKSLAGYYGEQSLDYYVSFLSEQDYVILHDLRLKGPQHFFQIDTLILSTAFFLILEIKHIAGTLLFDQTFHQLIRSNERGKEVFSDPLLQAERQAIQLNDWLQQHTNYRIPIEFLVVMTNTQALLEVNMPNNRTHRIIRSQNLAARVQELSHYYSEVRLSKTKLEQLAIQLLKAHTPNPINVLDRFRIHPVDLLTGVHCPNCERIPMERVGYTWKCTHCSFSSTSAYIFSARDYALLITPHVQNAPLREFLHIRSRRTMLRLLHSLAVSYRGGGKGRVYELPIHLP